MLMYLFPKYFSLSLQGNQVGAIADLGKSSKLRLKIYFFESSAHLPQQGCGAFIFKIMKYLRRRIIAEIAGSPQKQKAIAFALLLKDRTGDSSVVRDFSIYRIQKLTKDKRGKGGMAYKTIRKYLGVLMKMGYAEMKGGDLFLKRMSSSSKHRNINISAIRTDKNKNVYNQIRELLFLSIQAHKDFIHSLLRLRKDPPKGVDYKKVRRLCKKCCDNPNADYKEYGLSYRCISEKIGCCVRTAFTIVKDAVRRRWCEKQNHCTVDYLPGVNFADLPNYTFTSYNYGFVLRSNTYTLSRAWADALCADAYACVRVRVHGCAGVRVRPRVGV